MIEIFIFDNIWQLCRVQYYMIRDRNVTVVGRVSSG